jgi:hypothetical protein
LEAISAQGFFSFHFGGGFLVFVVVAAEFLLGWFFSPPTVSGISSKRKEEEREGRGSAAASGTFFLFCFCFCV